MTCAARLGDTFPYAVSTTAVAFSARPYDTLPACTSAGAAAGRDRPAARALPARKCPLRHLADHPHAPDLRARPRRSCRPAQPGAASAPLRLRIRLLALARVRIPRQAAARCPGCPARLRSLRRSRSDSCRRRPARPRSFAPIRSFELGVPESEPRGWPALLAGHLLGARLHYRRAVLPGRPWDRRPGYASTGPATPRRHHRRSGDRRGKHSHSARRGRPAPHQLCKLRTDLPKQ